MSEFDLQAWNWDKDAAKVERARQVAAAIRAQAGPLAGMRALEFGCGTGLLGFALQSDLAHVTLADTSQGMLAVLREKIAASGVTHMTALDLDLTSGAGDPPDGPYDLVFTLMTLHHIADVDALLARFHALLAPGGRLCVSDLDAEDGSFHDFRTDVHKGFERGAFAARLGRAGFVRPRFSTPFVIERGTGVSGRYPLFLVVAERP